MNVFCTSFVIYKGHECFAKFLGHPQTSHVAIEHISKHSYPAITICHKDKQKIYEETLAKCNLTYDQYHSFYMWTGNGTEDFCSDPTKLYDKMSGKRQSIIKLIWLIYFGKKRVFSDGR